MRIVQPSEMKVYFELEQELHLQDTLKKQFKGKIAKGFYTLSWLDQGRHNQMYLVGFLCEVTNTGAVIIIECYVAHESEYKREKFDAKIEKFIDNAESNPNTAIARATYEQNTQEILMARKRIELINRRRKN